MVIFLLFYSSLLSRLRLSWLVRLLHQQGNRHCFPISHASHHTNICAEAQDVKFPFTPPQYLWGYCPMITKFAEELLLTKYAGIRPLNHLMTFLRDNTARLNAKLKALRKPGALKTIAANIVKNKKPEIAGAVAGTAGGAYMGNQAYNNAIPSVRALPDIQPSPYIATEQPYGAGG